MSATTAIASSWPARTFWMTARSGCSTASSSRARPPPHRPGLRWARAAAKPRADLCDRAAWKRGEYTPAGLRDPARILVADDTPANVRMLETRLSREGYEVLVARDGEETLAHAREALPDLILLDIMMPKLDGIEVCRRLKGDAKFPFTPIIMVTALSDTKDIVAGFEAGGDDYLAKPIDGQALSARVRSMLRIKSLHDTVKAQALELERWNATLEERVKTQLAELERVGRLKRFVSPQLTELIVQGGAGDPLASHRREVTVVFLDL